MPRRALVDPIIEEGLERSGVVPDFVEWYGNPEHRVRVRIEPHMGHYIEGDFWPWMDVDDVSDKLKRMSRELDARRAS